MQGIEKASTTSIGDGSVKTKRPCEIEVAVMGDPQTLPEEYLQSEGCCTKAFPSGYWAGLKQILNLTWGLIIIQMAQILIQPATIVFAGHLNSKLILDTIALGQTLVNITGYSIVWGMGTAGDTLFSQTIGSKNTKLVGVQLQRSLIIQFLALCVCWAIHLNIEGLLLLFGQDPDVARQTGRYMLIFMPGMLFLHMYVMLRKWIQCQNIVNPMIGIGLAGLGAHLLFQWIFLYVLDWGTDGSAIGLVMVYFLLLAMTILYVFISGIYKDTWDGWDKRMFDDWWEYTRLAIFGLLMTCLEWWAFEVTVILAGTIGTTELGAQSVIFSVDSLIFGIPSGIAVAVTIRVGQCLGAGRPLEAKTAARIGFSICTILTAIIAIILAVFRNEIPSLLTNVKDVVDLVAAVIPIVAYYSVADAVTSVSRGIMRGCGKQAAATVIIFIAYYVIALPIGICLLYLTQLKTIGLWIGLATALTVCAIIYLVYINVFFNWTDLSLKARERARVDKTLEEEVNGELPNETSPLLGNEKSQDVTDSEAKHKKTTVSKKTVIIKLLIVAGFVIIVGIGALCRLFIPLPVHVSQDGDHVNITYTTGSKFTTTGYFQ